MKKLFLIFMSLLFACAMAIAAQNPNSSTTGNSNSAGTTKVKKPRGPVFRATKEQIKQAQSIMKRRGFYSGEESGKLDDETRAGLKKYQAAENIKVTGTLNKVTLVQMGVELTDKQKAM